MSDYTGRFGIDPCDEPDYSDEIPEPESFSFEFLDGSRIVLVDFDYQIVTGHRKCEARDVAKWIEETGADNDQAIKYILKNYKA